MPKKRNLASIGGLGRRTSKSLDHDPGAGRATSALGASDVSLGGPFTVDKNQRLSFKKAKSVQLSATAEVEDLQATLNQLITTLRTGGLIED